MERQTKMPQLRQKDGLKAWMNKMDKAIFVMMTIWDNMKQKSFSYLLVTHHGGMLCAVCQTFAVWWVDVLTHHICRMASRRDELQTRLAVAYVVDSQQVMPYCRGWLAFLENILHFTALQKHTFCVPKGALSACKRPCFGVPFAVFCKAPYIRSLNIS